MEITFVFRLSQACMSIVVLIYALINRGYKDQSLALSKLWLDLDLDDNRQTSNRSIEPMERGCASTN